MKIGVFDSGLGGLIILKEIIKKLPQYDYIYLGDNARTPYGNRSQEVIYKFTEQAVDFLFKQNCQLIIIACNTASAEALRKIQQEWLPRVMGNEYRVLGVIRPVVEQAVKVGKNKIGVIGTKGTVASQSYIHEIAKLNSELEVLQQPCPLLVPLVEEGWQKSDVAKKVLRTYLKPLKLAKVDTLILGCTHYPILFKEIQGIMGPRTKVLHSGKIVADSLANYLQRHPEIESKLEKNTNVMVRISNHDADDVTLREPQGDITFYVTDLSPHYQRLGEDWFGKGIMFEKVEL
ncbi:MAG: glutamate racemase [Candidatus Buchananbacteria bacterium RBG_13_39_9]|uniref:Glutamate racemase n=1 Tax=Candidatus Buchananbacteria bacterium RBG_13_39_9 TaxID=1797531 RepID=A0A1G1XNW6_9BACT|nr:MAG: glutamate racemase [Candidatus Buchananbacteria bacterium RBG_13_39_9]